MNQDDEAKAHACKVLPVIWRLLGMRERRPAAAWILEFFRRHVALNNGKHVQCGRVWGSRYAGRWSTRCPLFPRSNRPIAYRPWPCHRYQRFPATRVLCMHAVRITIGFGSDTHWSRDTPGVPLSFPAKSAGAALAGEPWR